MLRLEYMPRADGEQGMCGSMSQVHFLNSRMNNGCKDGLVGLSTTGISSRVLSLSSVPPTPRSKGEILKSNNWMSFFTFVKVRAYTRKFRLHNVIGEAGLGSVLKCWIDENTLAATKPGTRIRSFVPVARKVGWSIFQPIA